jgi:hypothetical protein
MRSLYSFFSSSLYRAAHLSSSAYLDVHTQTTSTNALRQ